MNQQGLGPLTPYHPPSKAALLGYSVNRDGQNEVVWQPQYDYQTYGVGGATQFTFFQTPLGQGGTTLADTSMKAAGQFPNPTEFLVTGIQVFFRPGNQVGRAALASNVVPENINDVNDILFADSWLELFIGSKPYLDDAPVGKFTQQFGIVGTAAMSDATTAAATQKTMVDYARHAGRYYAITPVKLTTNQNFAVTINFPVAIAASVAAVMGVILDGFLYRLSQ